MRNVEILREVDAGTEMGDYLRHYWWPIASTAEFRDKDAKAVRILGEDLVLYRDLSNRWGLIDRMCAHRHADMSFGFVEEDGIRCPYHGWMYDTNGQLVEAPFEDTVNPNNQLKKQCKLKAYKVKEHAGLLFVYLGKDPAPELPIYDFLNWKHGLIEIARLDMKNNWMQHQENSYDPVHFEWSHENWDVRRHGGDKSKYVSKFAEFKFNEFEFGFDRPTARVDGKELDSRTTLTMWPNGKIRHFACRPRFGENSDYPIGKTFIKWVIPVDKDTSYYLLWAFVQMPVGAKIPEDNITYWNPSIYTPEGVPDYNIQLNQDIIICGGHGFYPESRKDEMLGESDRGIIMFRKKLFEDLERVKQGLDPKATIRDPEAAKNVTIPIFRNDEEERRNYKWDMPYEMYINTEFYKRRLKRVQVKNVADDHSADKNHFNENNIYISEEALRKYVEVVESAKPTG
jgi:5,5'-dehydrodivanillate O-demethylase